MASRADDGVDWRDGFLFVGGHPAVDFANTRLEIDGAPVETLGTYAAIVRWLVAVGFLSRAAARRLERDWNATSAAHRATRDVLAFREQLRGAISRLAAGEQPGRALIAELNRWLSACPVRIRLKPSRGGTSRERVLEPTDPRALIMPIADAAASLLVDVDPGRVRRCERCVAYFCDTTKNGLRRWCSMRLCGNRAKVARYAKRHRRQSRTGAFGRR